jgi:D-aminopeptidase
VNGVAVGPLPGEEAATAPGGSGPGGSIIVVVATDAPLLPGQCDRLAQRAALGVGRVGGAGEHASGDLILAFATGNRGLRPLVDHGTEGAGPVEVRAVAADRIDNLFYAAIEATEEAIVNALVAGQTMTGRDGYAVQGIGGDRLAVALGVGP